ncbi:MAG: hypothetical protein Q7R30_06105, partial [Acidobacteriota bacterium]|nr:hypothetical protein [Acidobacteriota bacterium]
LLQRRPERRQLGRGVGCRSRERRRRLARGVPHPVLAAALQQHHRWPGWLRRRWEYQPGSALFVVFQQGKSDGREHGDFQFRRDLGGVFSAPSHNVFLVKFSYWLNM